VEKIVRLTFAASYGEFINRNFIESYYMAAYKEFSMTAAYEILLYLVITFCAYVVKTQSLSGTTVSDCHNIFGYHLDSEHSESK